MAEQSKRIEEQQERIQELEGKLQAAVEKLEDDARQTALAKEELSAVEAKIKQCLKAEEEKMLPSEEEKSKEPYQCAGCWF